MGDGGGVRMGMAMWGMGLGVGGVQGWGGSKGGQRYRRILYPG